MSQDPSDRPPLLHEDRFFLVGPPKTGTTLLARMIDQHPDAACLSESFALHPWFEDDPARGRIGSIVNSRSTKGRQHGFSRKTVRNWERRFQQYLDDPRLQDLERRTSRKYPLLSGWSAVFPEIMQRFGKKCKARVVGDKWPLYFEFMGFVMEAFGWDTPLIYTVRDPRAVWYSAETYRPLIDGKRADPRRGSGDKCINLLMEAERQMSAFKHAKILVVRYEDLVRQPEAIMPQVFAHIGLDCKPEYLNYQPAKDPYPDRWDWIPNATEPMDETKLERWRRDPEQLDDARFRTLTAFTREYCVRYRYPVHFDESEDPEANQKRLGEPPLRPGLEPWLQWLQGKPMAEIQGVDKVESVIRRECIALHNTFNLAERMISAAAHQMVPPVVQELDVVPSRSAYLQGYRNGAVHAKGEASFALGHVYNYLHRFGMGWR